MDFKQDFVEEKAKRIRYLTMDALGKLGVGHAGGCLSIADVLAVLYFGGVMQVDPLAPNKQGRDRLVISKGHAGPALYATLAEKGYFPLEWLDTVNQPGTRLPSHCDMKRTPGVDMTAGSLGQGFSCAVGAAVGSKIKKDGATVYAIIGDGESQEGQIWEAAMFAAQKKLGNLIGFTDYNRMQIDGTTDEINSLGDIVEKWQSFGWDCIEVKDGNNVAALYTAIQAAKEMNNDKPSMLVLHTVKGKGVSFVEKAGIGSHNMPISPEQHKQALSELS